VPDTIIRSIPLTTNTLPDIMAQKSGKMALWAGFIPKVPGVTGGDSHASADENISSEEKKVA
jgi:hypothetical protein